MALNRSDKSRILRRYFPGMTRNSEMSTEPNAAGRLHQLSHGSDVFRGRADGFCLLGELLD